ncbi:uncharacterized protein RHO25_000454 [Cercospora beticola]|uniref:UBC core domain-containing protein n=2 Tax=Cercospora beticola TaxID=122368 RepID=A0ABZ0N8L9_CERBT|nr:hypothetical protein RHO25_000454 [Cercospora beticola]
MIMMITAYGQAGERNRYSFRLATYAWTLALTAKKRYRNMNSKTLRRLAADHAQLHNDLPTNYLFPPNPQHDNDLSQLDVLLAGPTHTPFAAGVWKLHLAIPDNYPQQPPTANFRTKIFHPNVNEKGQICVETLKRDWDSKLTLRDVLVTISCLLIQPNPDSALNAEAGALIQQDYDAFAQRVELMTSIHASIPPSLTDLVKEAQNRGQEPAPASEPEEDVEDSMMRPEQPVRRRRTIAKVRGLRRTETSPGDAPARRARRPPAANPPSRPFVVQSTNDDVFGAPAPQRREEPATVYENEDDRDSEMLEADQENDAARSPAKTPSVGVRTPRRPHGMPVPLGELILPEQDEGGTSVDDTDMDMEPEYPPSPRKSPSKNPTKQFRPALDRAESSRDAASRGAPMITPPNLNDKPLTLAGSVSPRRADRGRRVAFKLSKRHTPDQQPDDSSFLESSFMKATITPAVQKNAGVLKNRSPNSSSIRREEAQRRAELNEKLWEACGRDIKRWNRGDFDGDMLTRKAPRW